LGAPRARPESPSPPRKSSDILTRGTDSSNPCTLGSAGESVSPMNSAAARRRRRLASGTVRG
jgi:hypothetical protein